MLRVENLCKHFNIHILNDKIIEGFSNINFNVKQCTSFGISAPSGAGKSSILKCIYRTYLSTSGDIHYESSQFGNVNLAREKEHVVLKIRENELGYITQFLRVIPRVSCMDIVAEPLISSGTDKIEANEKARKLLVNLGIPEKLYDAYPSTFSGGEQQRVNIAKEVIRQPRLLLLDEPTASLDRKSVSMVLNIFKELKSKGTTMIGIFHDNEVMKEFADEIYYLKGAEVYK